MNPAVYAVIGAVVGAFFSFLATVITARTTILGNVLTRLKTVEEKEKDCREEVFGLRTDMQSMEFMVDILLQHYPDGDDKVKEARDRIRTRRKLKDEAEAKKES